MHVVNKRVVSSDSEGLPKIFKVYDNNFIYGQSNLWPMRQSQDTKAKQVLHTCPHNFSKIYR